MREAFVCEGIRTPIGRYGGALANMRPDDMGAVVLRHLVENCRDLDPERIDDVIMGCANQSGEDNRNVARMSLLLAGLPGSVSGTTVNRLCGSSMDAIISAARSVKAGEADLIIAGGVESMTRAPFVIGKSESAFGRNMKLEDTTLGWRFINPRMAAAYGVDAMALTAENVADEYKISREDQDSFALRSQQRAAAAEAVDFFSDEVTAVTVTNGKKDTVVTKDEHPRPESTLEGLAALKPAVKADGSVTAGNASGINDGGSAVVIASEAAIKEFQLVPKVRVIAGAAAGVAPRIMGIGPVPATLKLFAKTGVTVDRLDVIELNEAFASQSLACLRQLQIPDDDARVNPNGGAIALGHPLGASGARLVLTASRQLSRIGGRYALCTMCIGVGQGIAVALERV